MSDDLEAYHGLYQAGYEAGRKDALDSMCQAAAVGTGDAVSPTALQAGAQWRPISEAEPFKEPLDEATGRHQELLLWMGGSFQLGSWDDNRFAGDPKPYWVAYSPLGKTWCRNNQPTHFMPLPSPPSQLEERVSRDDASPRDGRQPDANKESGE
jgi:hypothetical protein